MKALQVLYVLCFTRPRYQVSVYRTTGPLVFLFDRFIQNLGGEEAIPEGKIAFKRQSLS